MQHLIKILLLMTPVSCFASTVSASVECNDEQSYHLTTYGTVTCVWGVATVQPTSVLAKGSSPGFYPYGSWGTATAQLDDDVVLTISGRTGSGFFLPCFELYGTAAASLGSFSTNSFQNCWKPEAEKAAMALPFVFDTPLSLHLTMSAAGVASVFGWDVGSADLQRFEFFDVQHHPINDVTYVLTTTAPVAIPEPQPWATAGLGLMAISALTILRRKRTTLYNSADDEHRC